MLTRYSPPTRPWRVAAALLLNVCLLGLPIPTGGVPARPDASPPPLAALVATYGRLPLSFEANQDQAGFVARGHGYTLGLSSAEATLSLRQSPTLVRLRLVGANPRADGVGEQLLQGVTNYFVGDDPQQWRTAIPTYGRVQYREVYPGIDVSYYGATDGQLENDFRVAAGADPGLIRFVYEGAEQVQLEDSGSLVLQVGDAQVHQAAPVVYQDGADGPQTVASAYYLDADGQVSFALGAYDATRPLVIDPVLVYSTYLGGTFGDEGRRIAVDAAGSAYVTGLTGSSNFPSTPGAAQSILAGVSDVFVSKLDPSGTRLIYSTYLGGRAIDMGAGIAVDSGGNAYITGTTSSSNFPTTPGALRRTFDGGSGGTEDAFVSKLNPTGTALLYSTFLGGTGPEQGLGIALDAAGNAYVTGGTSATDFPTTPGALQSASNGFGDAFVSKVNPSGTGLLYSTYLGGSGFDVGNDIAVDVGGNAYVTGITGFTDFPTTPGAFNRVFSAPSAAFASKLNPSATALAYSTFLGSSTSDGGFGIAVDKTGNAFVTGETATRDGIGDAFVDKLNPTGSDLVYSRLLGGSFLDLGTGIAVDAAGNAFVAGITGSLDFPTTTDAFQPSLAGDFDTFVSKLDPSGTGLVYSTYLGGSGADKGAAGSGPIGIAVDRSSNAFVSGTTSSTDFPTTPGAVQRTFNGGEADAFVARIGAPLLACATTISGSRSNLVIRAGATTCLAGAQVTGAVVVQSGAQVLIESSTVGSIVASAPGSFALCDTTVRGAVQVADASGAVLIGGPDTAACPGNTITGGVVLRNNQDRVVVVANHIGGSLICSDNVPAPSNAGHANTVRGARTGQCQGL